MEWIVSNIVPVSVIWAAIATTWAAISTWRLITVTKEAPINAANLASHLQDESERRRLKLWVFGTIMQNRRTLGDVECAKAINLIDTVFFDDAEVRDAWAKLYAIFNDPRMISDINSVMHILDERRDILLTNMAKSLGFVQTFRPDDFARIYFPRGINADLAIRNMQQSLTLKLLSDQIAADEKAKSPA